MSAELPPLAPDIAELLRRERDAEGPSSDARARIERRVIASIGAGVGTAVLAKSAATGKAAVMGGVASKLTIVVVACAVGTGAIGAGAYALVHHRATSTARAERIASPAPVVTHPVVVPPTPAVEPTPAETPSALPSPPKTTAPTHVVRHDVERADLREERALLAIAHDALAASDAPGAIAALDRHARRFPSGQLAEERECLRIRALVEAGDHAAADRAAAAFTLRYPDSLFHAATCASRDGTR